MAGCGPAFTPAGSDILASGFPMSEVFASDVLPSRLSPDAAAWDQDTRDQGGRENALRRPLRFSAPGDETSTDGALACSSGAGRGLFPGSPAASVDAWRLIRP